MPEYSYTAVMSGGQTVSATAHADDLPELAARLAGQGASIQTARRAREPIRSIRGIPYFEIIAVYRQIASSLEGGLPLVETLEMLSSESRNRQLKSLLYALKSDVASGLPLSEAMAPFPGVFPDVHLAVIRAGEESGLLERCLADLADQAETLSNMNRRFASALVYPTVISVVALALLNLVTFFIVPQFLTLFGDLGIADVSSFSHFVLFMVGRVLPIGALVLIAAAILLTLILVQRRAAAGRLWLDTWKLRLPVVGQIVEKAALARFSGTLGLLLEAGVDVPRAVRLASEGAGNRTIERLLKRVSSEVESGESLGESMDKSGSIAPSLAWRVSVGEETGALPRALLDVSRLYAKQVDSLVTSLAGLLEPVLIIVIGTGVAMLVLGLFLPLASIISALCNFSG